MREPTIVLRKTNTVRYNRRRQTLELRCSATTSASIHTRFRYFVECQYKNLLFEVCYNFFWKNNENGFFSSIFVTKYDISVYEISLSKILSKMFKIAYSFKTVSNLLVNDRPLLSFVFIATLLLYKPCVGIFARLLPVFLKKL